MGKRKIRLIEQFSIVEKWIPGKRRLIFSLIDLIELELSLIRRLLNGRIEIEDANIVTQKVQKDFRDLLKR